MVAIFVLTMFLLLLAVDLVVLKIQKKFHPAFEPSYHLLDSSVFNRKITPVPFNIFLSKGHVWLKRNDDGLLSIGIDEFGTKALGELSILKCASVGKVLKRGEILFEGAYGNTSVKFLSPINGIVKSVNENILGKIIYKPYESWGVQIASDELLEGEKTFVSGNEALNWIKKEYVKLKDFIINHSLRTDAVGATMLDGGSLSNDTISLLVDNTINDFEKEFLSL